MFLFVIVVVHIFIFFYHSVIKPCTFLVHSTCLRRRVSYKKRERLTLREHIRSSSVFGGVRVAHGFSFLCCVAILCFVCLRPVSCLPHVDSVSGLFVFVLCLVYSTLTVSLECLSSSCVLCTPR
jgi:formate hydrogenlyase subunit 3/multisubunit Na+/H+ antiporter MnhD subunit